MEIRAAVLERFGAPLVVQDVELAPPRAEEVLVRLKACGVCHSDLIAAKGDDPDGYVPCVLGHEGAGVVEAVGEGVTSVEPGDHVLTLFSPECGTCLHCRSGKTNICTRYRKQQYEGVLPDGTTRLSRGGEPLLHFMGTSTYAEYTVMPEYALAKIDRGASLEQVCLLACGATTGIASAMWRAEVEAGSTVAVFGLGMVGLGALVGARLRKAARIIAVDLSPGRLETAKAVGATHIVLASEGDAVEAILDLTDGYGADYTFEATGQTKVMAQAVRAARFGWGLATILGVAGKGQTLAVVPNDLLRGRRIQGGSFGGARGRTHVPQLVDMVVRGELDLAPFVSRRISLDQINEAFDHLEQQDGIRSVIEF